VLVFTDTYQRFDPRAIRSLVRAVTGRWSAATGHLELRAGGAESLPLRVYWRLELWLRAREARLHSPVGVTGAIWAMRKDRWKALPEGLILDDLWTPMRLVLEGDRVGFVDTARAWETRPASASNEYRRKVRTQTGVLQLCRWMPRILSPFRNVLWLQFVAHKLLRLLTPFLVLVVVSWAALELAALASRNRLPTLAVVIVVLAALFATRGRLLAATLSAVRTGAVVQIAAISAIWNGIRGRWDVW
jgi:hypothetical protein